jgi:aminopeptidase
MTRLADTLVNYCVEVGPGDKVVLSGTVATLPLVLETYRHVLEAGGHPLLQLDDERFTEMFLGQGSDEQLRFIPEPQRIIFETYDCLISIRGSNNTRALSGIDPQRQQLWQKARSELMGVYMRRAAEGSLRWVATMFPTAAQAQEADMSLGDYEDFVYGACFADQDDPIATWKSVGTRQQTLVDWLAGKDKVVVRGPNIDMQLSIAGRTFMNADGKRNMPDGEIFTGPVEHSVNGWVRFTYPAIVNGREVDGVELHFENGQVIKASAAKNNEYLQRMLETDEGARYLGEFAVGTNYGIDRFTKSILYDEKIGGTLHMALGRGYPDTGSKNVSGIHWDMICDMRDGSQMLVDDELIYENGRFLI